MFQAFALDNETPAKSDLGAPTTKNVYRTGHVTEPLIVSSPYLLCLRSRAAFFHSLLNLGQASRGVE